MPKIGLTMCYHNHAFEFAPSGSSGILLDVLMKVTDPKLVSLELDMMWAQVAGVDPVSVLEKYGDRMKLMHLKDVVAMPKRYNEEHPGERVQRSRQRRHQGRTRFCAAAARPACSTTSSSRTRPPGDPIASLSRATTIWPS